MAAIDAPEGSPAYYRQLAAFVRSRTYRDTHGSIDYSALDREKLRMFRRALSSVRTARSIKDARRMADAAFAEDDLSDEALITKMMADDVAKAVMWEAKAAELEAKLADVIPLNTAAFRQVQHIAESVAKSEAKREVAAATCSDDNLESNLRASLGATNNDFPKGAA
jgi:hypothetical protein